MWAIVRWRWPVLALWAGLSAAAIAGASRVRHRLDVRGGSLRPTEASRAAAILESRFPRDVGEMFVLVLSGPAPFGAGRPRQVLDDLLATLAREPYVADVAEVAAPGRTAVALVTLKVSDPDSVLALVPVARAAARRALGALPPPDRDAYEALVTGDTPLERDMLTVTTEDVERSEWRLVPLTGAILLVALGSPVAAALPLVVGFLAIVAALALVGTVASALPVSIYAVNVTTMIGLAVGIDYSLLIATRFSEELERDGSASEAAVRTLGTAGRTVAVSGLTVAVGFAALFATPLVETRSIGLGGLVAVTCAVALRITDRNIVGTSIGYCRRPGLLAYAIHYRRRNSSVSWPSSSRRVPTFTPGSFSSRWSFSLAVQVGQLRRFIGRRTRHTSVCRSINRCRLATSIT